MLAVELINAILENLPVGFGFRPTDEELVDHYLKPKIRGMGSHVDIIPEVDVCKKEPWELPGLSVIKTADLDWFFFSPVDYKYSNGSRVNRQTETGYWKPTGQDREIKSGTKKIGTKKSLVFYKGQGRTAVKTNWVIHQYRAEIASPPANRDYVLCHLMEKTDENTGSNIPIPDENNIQIPDETVAGTGIHLDGPGNNMPLGAGPSHHGSNIASDFRNYEVEEMILDDPELELQGLLHEPAFHPLDYDLFIHTEQGPDLDLSSPSGFNNSYGSMQFDEGDDIDFDDGLFIDSDGYPCRGLSGQRSSAVDSGNPRHGSISRLSARPQSPLKGAYVKGGGSSSGTDTEVLHAKYSQVPQASSLTGGLGSSKECMPPPMVQQLNATSRSSSINQHKDENKSSLHDESRRFGLDNFVAQGVAPKSVKLAGNDSNNEMLQLQAKLAKLSCSITKQEENSVSVQAKDRAEYGSASNLLQNKNPIRESKKDFQVTEKSKPKLSSTTRWNDSVGGDQKGSSNSPETASASHEPSSSPDYLVNSLVGIILLVILIVVMVLDIAA